MEHVGDESQPHVTTGDVFLPGSIHDTTTSPSASPLTSEYNNHGDRGAGDDEDDDNDDDEDDDDDDDDKEVHEISVDVDMALIDTNDDDHQIQILNSTPVNIASDKNNKKESKDYWKSDDHPDSDEGEPYGEEDTTVGVGRWSHTNVLRRLANHRKKALEIPDRESTLSRKNTVLRTVINDLQGVKEIMSSLKKKNQAALEHERKNPVKVIHQLSKRAIVITDLTLLLAVIGIVFMIMAHEERLSNGRQVTGLIEFYRWVMTVSTGFLILGLYSFYSTLAHIKRMDNPLFHGHSGWTVESILMLFLEICVCVIHPFPDLQHSFKWDVTDIATGKDFEVVADMDVLGVFMFMRLYLMVRFLNLHAEMNTTSTSKFLAKLNYIEFDSWITIKVHLHYNPMTFIFGVLIVYILVASYTTRICEGFDEDGALASFSNNVWVVIITMLTVGYGDMVPGSTCGRALAVVSGTFGMVISALVVAVLTSAIKLNHTEETLLDFIHKESARQEYVRDASDVIVHAYRTYKLRKNGRWLKYAIYNYFLVLKLAKFRKDRRTITRDIQNHRILRPYYDFFLDQLEFRKNDLETFDEAKKSMEQRIENIEKSLEAMPAKIAELLLEAQKKDAGKEKRE